MAKTALHLKIDVSATHKDVGKKAADLIAQLLRKKPDAVIGLPTGATPLPMYAELVRLHQQEALRFSRATFFNLDEYIGLPPDHPKSYHYYMWEHFFRFVDAKKRNIYIPNGMAKNIHRECKSYEAKILKCGGIDLQLLGIGTTVILVFVSRERILMP